MWNESLRVRVRVRYCQRCRAGMGVALELGHTKQGSEKAADSRHPVCAVRMVWERVQEQRDCEEHAGLCIYNY